MNNSACNDSTAAASPGRWLVVDDEPELADLLAMLLTEMNRGGVESYSSSPEALSAFSAHSREFDLVITDRDMPLLDGLEFARQLRAEAPHLKVIMVSAHTDDLSIEVLRRAGIDAVLEKPFTLTALETTIRQMTLHPAFSDACQNPLALAQAA